MFFVTEGDRHERLNLERVKNRFGRTVDVLGSGAYPEGGGVKVLFEYLGKFSFEVHSIYGYVGQSQ